jgi:hypothetical protein
MTRDELIRDLKQKIEAQNRICSDCCKAVDDAYANHQRLQRDAEAAGAALIAMKDALAAVERKQRGHEP